MFSSKLGGGGRSHPRVKVIGFERFVFARAVELIGGAQKEENGGSVGSRLRHRDDLVGEATTQDLVSVAHEAAVGVPL